MSRFTLHDVREQTYKPRDSWWTVLLVDPLAARLVRFTANRTSITPNQLTIAALVLGGGAAGCFAMAEPVWLVAGALLFHLSFVLDCMDGKIARLKGNGSVFGSWLDYVFDRLRVLVCAVALMGGQFAATGDQIFVWFAMAIVFTDMFRYLNSPQMAKVRRSMRRNLTRAIREADAVEAAVGGGRSERAASAMAAGDRLSRSLSADQQLDEVVELRPRAAEDVVRPEADSAPAAVVPGPRATVPVVDEAALAAAEAEDEADGDEADGAETGKEAPTAGRRAREVQATELQRRFHTYFPWYIRFRDALRARRIRPHLVSGIEFQMGTFIVAPLAGAVTGSPWVMLAAIAVSGALMLTFELLLIYKLWLSTREYTRVLAGIQAAVPQAAPEGRPADAAEEAGEVPATAARPAAGAASGSEPVTIAERNGVASRG
ncbi:CDP-alcohol phosphatidyltransferase family protein [Marinactinospora rubrisoli]|uniref:CDP-alcohol phosphatidyltransferase family protein n=1 Tax=Marinactinospora rubrisoli TaxID=2715399 RepID=A0ABW2KLI4_9ACTN